MVLGGELRINVRVEGAEQLARLKDQTNAINNAIRDTQFIKQMAIAQTENEIAQLQLSNRLLVEKTKTSQQDISLMAANLNLQENLTFATQNRLQIEQEALRLRRMFASEGIQITMEEARVATQANQQIIAAENASAEALRMKRRALMQVSISLFVMNISANQLVSSLKPLVKGNEEATQAINNFQTMLNLAIGPMQFYLALLQIAEALQMRVAATAVMMAKALAGAFLWMTALTAKSKALRVVAGALAGVMTALAIKHFLAATAAVIQAGAIATLQAVVGSPAGFIALAAGLALTGVAVGLLGGLQSAQTLPRQAKYVREGGIARLDPGEIVTRPPAAGLGGGDTFQITITGDVTRANVKLLAKEIVRQKNMGAMRSTTRRATIG